METNTKNHFEGIKKVLVETSPNELEINLSLCILDIIEVCKKNKFVIESDGKEINTDDLMNLLPVNFEFDKLCKTRRKNLCTKMYFFMKKKSRRSMNALLYFITERVFEGRMKKIKIKPSKVEQEIIELRKKYKELKIQAEAARLVYKEKKGYFYK